MSPGPHDPAVCHVRRTELICEVLGDELVLYDGDAHVAHALTGPAAQVWMALGHGATSDQLIRLTGLDVHAISQALGELESAGLISDRGTMTRRTVLAGATAVGLAAPLVLSVPIASADGASSALDPTVTSLSPAYGPVSGGTSVTIDGTNFVAGDTSVDIGGIVIPSSSVTVESPTSLVFDTPAQAAGNVAVSVTTPSATSGDVPGGFTYD